MWTESCSLKSKIIWITGHPRQQRWLFAFALELDIDETVDFIGRAGFALSHSSKFDVIVEYFLVNRNYNIFELNEILFAFGQPLIGA